MPARTLPDRFSFLTPGMLKPMPVAERAHGIVAQPPHAPACSAVIGASDAPMSTARFVTCLMPSPEPTPEYLTGMPSLISKPLIQLVKSGWTRVEPAALRPAAEALAVDTAAVPPTVPPTAMRIASNLLRIKSVSFQQGWDYRRVGSPSGKAILCHSRE